jgi:hypothetical protein
MKAKIKGVKVDLKDWQSIKQLRITSYTRNGVNVQYEIQIYYPDVELKKRRRTFAYQKEKDMMVDYQKLIIKVLLK